MNEDDYWPNACAPGPQGKDKPGCSSKLAQLGIAAILALIIWHTATAQERTFPPPPQPISPIPRIAEPFPPQWVNMVHLPIIESGLRITGCNSDMENCP